MKSFGRFACSCSKKYPQEMGSAQFIRAMRKSGFVDER